ncbi:ATP-binding protein [Olsenella massiliensis]|uniref:ATP-binding protein n=1 Tax=Olsenella massiliensis TaxID=1622075 RepID=UPI00071D6029|nr:ATP-binding protein [Olsenella massiliensis]
MGTDELQELRWRLSALAVFRGLLTDPVVAGVTTCLEAVTSGASWDLRVSRYGELVSRLYKTGSCCLAAHVRNAALEDENAYLRLVGAGEEVAPSMEAALRAELRTLERVCRLAPADLVGELPAGVDGELLPSFEPGDAAEGCLSDAYAARRARLGTQGFGIYARYHVFAVGDEGQIEPVRYPDPIRLEDLVDYERERAQILDNTRALLAGRPAANILLTGDAGTGKSSTIKAVANELAPRGLRILEVRKEQLRDIPQILEELTRNPLKFVIFIDDLSFSCDDDNFAALKAILEGSVSAKSDNVAIYATSNRRHLVRESFSDRDGDDVHLNDTMQEIISLSDRFGLHVTFTKPDRATYLDIVRKLAHDAGVTMDEGELDLLAERFATRRAGRSARGARQFVDSLVARGA